MDRRGRFRSGRCGDSFPECSSSQKQSHGSQQTQQSFQNGSLQFAAGILFPDPAERIFSLLILKKEHIIRHFSVDNSLLP